MLFKYGWRYQIYDSIQTEKSMESDFTSASRPLIPSKISVSNSEIREQKNVIPKHETLKRASKWRDESLQNNLDKISIFHVTFGYALLQEPCFCPVLF